MARRLFLMACALAALAGGVAAYRWLNPADQTPIVLSGVELPDLDGRPRRLDAWQGQVVVVNFWATWCPPCREEIPAFNQLQRQLGGRGLQFIGIALDEADAVRDFQAALPMDYPVLIAADAGTALMEEWGNRLGVLPYTVVFDRGGRLAYRHPGLFAAAQARQILEPLLNEGNSR